MLVERKDSYFCLFLKILHRNIWVGMIVNIISNRQKSKGRKRFCFSGVCKLETLTCFVKYNTVWLKLQLKKQVDNTKQQRMKIRKFNCSHASESRWQLCKCFYFQKKIFIITKLLPFPPSPLIWHALTLLGSNCLP